MNNNMNRMQCINRDDGMTIGCWDLRYKREPANKLLFSFCTGISMPLGICGRRLSRSTGDHHGQHTSPGKGTRLADYLVGI